MLARPNFASSIVGHGCSGFKVRKSPPEQSGHMAVGSTYLFQGLVHNVPGRCDLFLLTDSVDAVQGLVLYHGVPLRLHEEDVVCNGQI